MKQIIIRKFSSFFYFYQYLKARIFLAIFLSIGVGVLDGFGMSMFLPLLQMVNETEAVDSGKMGNLKFILELFEKFNINIKLGSVLLVMITFFVLKGAVKYISLIYRVYLQQYFIRKLRISMLESLNKMNYKYFMKTDPGRIQNTMTGEVDRVSNAYIYYFIAFEHSILVTVYMGFAFFVDSQFALLVTIGGMMTNFLYKNLYKKTKGASKKLTDESNIYQGGIIQHVSNYKYLKATGYIENFSNRLRENIFQIELSRKRIGTLSGLLESAREPLIIIVVALVIFIQIKFLSTGLGSILISLLFFYRALTSLTLLQSNWNKFLGLSGSLSNMQSFQQEISGKEERIGKKGFKGFEKNIKLEKVHLQFEEKIILENINFSVLKNQSVAFVGESGSGKTTLVNVICGLITPDKGHIYVDNESLEDLDKRSYQKKIGYITQDPVIFNDTLFNNVTLWAEPTEANVVRFNQVIKSASLSEFLESLPSKDQTILGNNGINLSGGQKQRISIARELFKDIDILIMDEATSALDSETEKNIQESIESLKGQYTMIIIAHRLSTIYGVDRVVYIEKGKILAEGKFDELYNILPQFKRMVQLQKLSGNNDIISSL